ncbi:MAG: hypothetical protein GC157_16655 [Frankiales bacterium]|nr:hypothetical protein [Frankiales bacterium]
MHHAHAPRRRALAARTAVLALLATALVAGALSAPAGAATTQPPRRIVTGWLPYWSSSTSTASVTANADLFTDVSPFWYTAQLSGTTSSIAQLVSSSSKATYLPQLKAAGVRVLPTITDGMGAHGMASTLASTTRRATFVNQIVSLVTSNGYDGIDLDFEGFAFNDGSSTWSTTRPNWVAFVRLLGTALHAQGKQLSIASPYLSSPTTGYWVYDWAGIGPYIDRLRIMTYDYHVASPGPIAPMSWVDSVARFAVTQVPSGKVQIGVASYGRDWYTGTSYSGGVVSSCPTTGLPGTSAQDVADLKAQMSWSRVTHTYTAAGAPSYLATWTGPAFDIPGVTVTSPPKATFDTTAQEKTFSSQVRFAGRANRKITVTATAASGATTLAVSSTSGISKGWVVSGTGIAAGTRVASVDGTGKTITLTAATTAAVNGAVSFTGLASAVCTISRTGWYDDASAAAARARLVGTYHLGGIAQWTIGGEDQSQWAALRSYARTIAPTPTVVRVATTSPTTYGQDARIVVTATSEGVPVESATTTLLVAHGATWRVADRGVTSTSGTVSFTRNVTSATKFKVIVASNFERKAGGAAGTLLVRSQVSVTPSYSAVTPGGSVLVIARAVPKHLGQRAVLQVLVKGRWRSLTATRADQWGRAIFRVSPTVRHVTTPYRVAFYGVPGIVGAYGYFGVHVSDHVS